MAPRAVACDDESVTTTLFHRRPAPVAVPPPAAAPPRRPVRRGRGRRGRRPPRRQGALGARGVRRAAGLSAAPGCSPTGCCGSSSGRSRPTSTRTVPRSERQQALGLAALGIGVGLAGSRTRATRWSAGSSGPLGRGRDRCRRRLAGGRRGPAPPLGRAGAAHGTARRRCCGWSPGAVFVAAGIAVFLLGNLELGQVQFALLAVLATLVGVAVITVPWWLRLVRDLGEERRERIVEAERAEIAAHLHDSVLQTLALIQRQSDQPREVLRLARGQERELRHWLYGPGGYGRPAAATRPGRRSGRGAHRGGGRGRGHLRDRRAARRRRRRPPAGRRPARARAGHPRGDGQRGQARRGGRDQRVRRGRSRTRCNVFVRDRGVGFDPDAVPDDRHGLADSVRGRMTRHGGTVRLRSTPGEGTEVHLRDAGRRTLPTRRLRPT